MEINTEVKAGLETEHIIDVSDRLYRIIIALGILALLSAGGYGFYQFQSLPQNAPHEINVTGDGKVFVKPDVALVTFGAHTEATKSQDAVNSNNKIMNAMISSIKALGVEDKDIQTTLYSLNPIDIYNYVTPMIGAAGSASSGVASSGIAMPVRKYSKGFALDQQISIKIRNFDKINNILDAATSAGANTVGSLQFTVDDFSKAQADARAKAIADAKTKANSLIGQAGFKSVKLVDISEGYSSVPGPIYRAMNGVAAATPSVAPQIQTGQTEVDSSVTLTYQVQ